MSQNEGLVAQVLSRPPSPQKKSKTKQMHPRKILWIPKMMDWKNVSPFKYGYFHCLNVGGVEHRYHLICRGHLTLRTNKN